GAGKLAAAGQPFDGATRPPHQALAAKTRFAAIEPVGRDTAMAMKERDVHRFEKADDAGDAIAARPSALAARAVADLEFLENDRIAEFEHFGIGQTGIGHVSVDGAGAVKTRTRARAAANGLIVLVS